MRAIIKKAVLVIFIFFGLFLTTEAYGEVTCCVGHGGEYACDYTNGTLYCKDGSISSDCTCRMVTPTLTPVPTFTPTPIKSPVPTPSCVVNATYDTSNRMCQCISGYTAYENSCIVFEQYCWKKFGGNSKYDANKDTCVCASGYSWNSKGTDCISYNEVCQNELGDKSYYNKEDNTCNCFQNYSIQDKKCQLIPKKETANIQQTSKSFPSPTNAPEPTVVLTNSNSPTPTNILNVKKSTIVKNDEENKNFVTEKKINENKIIEIISKIWDYITHFF